MVRFGHLERSVRDPAGAASYYVDVLGFRLVADQGPDFMWVGLGEVEILLRRGVGAAPTDAYAAAAAGIVLYTDNVDAEVDRLATHGVAMRGYDGPTNPTFTDPDGHWFQLANPQ